MKVVLDVNVFASASVFPGRTQGTVVNLGLMGGFAMVVSDPILDRLEVVLTRPYFAERLSETVRLQFLRDVRSSGKKEDPDPTVRGIAPDVEDDLVLGTAVAANADFLVTGDKGLLAILEYRGVRIVTSAEFLHELAREDSSGDTT
jgi:putative PIN family toxin of toxin-antitoxin system